MRVPQVAAPEVEALLTGAVVRPRELPGTLDGDSRVRLARKLFEAGFLAARRAEVDHYDRNEPGQARRRGRARPRILARASGEARRSPTPRPAADGTRLADGGYLMTRAIGDLARLVLTGVVTHVLGDLSLGSTTALPAQFAR